MENKNFSHKITINAISQSSAESIKRDILGIMPWLYKDIKIEEIKGNSEEEK